MLAAAALALVSQGGVESAGDCRREVRGDGGAPEHADGQGAQEIRERDARAPRLHPGGDGEERGAGVRG